ncbi:response regulator [Paramaledivibacter caminithermalis]|jgi:signal transduction histidine kinase|uniref:Stage 0 sporulation protein A homolog n=1 Tax=Paramaledivibacter caminithermalis (strain DSM 15212 / CIP 107654 / DViRD3) TaxID=1121301 RepID=A0A1M6JNY8_PARC5|nr:response regulator [Paramaledivibacter caminithermalis]SHJ48410.1 His Kinase A (phospho-acceptor) domain-containing protein [Paramaledivibacter caminithermalis DSM 15212]
MKILIIDDSKLVIEYAKSILLENNINCDIVTCNNGEDGLRILENEEIDVIILDIVMPNISGIEVLKRIRLNKKYDDVQILMFTSLQDKEFLKISFEYGATDFVRKPIEVIEFISRVKAAIRVRNYQLSLREALSILEDRNSQLVELNKQLKEAQDYMVQKEKLAAIGQLAAGVAHEINNPLGYVSSNTETLSKYIVKYKSIIKEYRRLIEIIEKNNLNFDEIMEIIKNIKKLENKLHINFISEDGEMLINDSFEGIERITKIVHSLKNFARDEKNDEYDNYDLTDIIEETLLLIKNEYKYSIDIEKDFQITSQIFCNRIQISQVIMNIIINAVQAIKSQNRNDRGLIRIKVYQQEGYVICEIKDNGPGIEKQNINKIFNPFFTTKNISQGTGLGLNIAYDIIVNKHGGDIFVESELGKYTIFTIVLPIKKLENN